MDKVELLDELRLEIGDLGDRYQKEPFIMFQEICRHVQNRVEDYEGVAVYLTEYPNFVRRSKAGVIRLPQNQKFGEGPLSVTAVRGGLYCERNIERMLVCIPFYIGQMVYGIFVVESNSSSQINDDDITLFTEICSSFENKIVAYYSPELEEDDSLEEDLDE